VRRSAELDSELMDALDRISVAADRLRSGRAQLDLLADWDCEYYGGFLYPLAFLDRVADLPDWSSLQGKEGTLPEHQAADLARFIEDPVKVGFRWPKQGGTDAVQLCLVPSRWRQSQTVAEALDSGRLDENQLAAPREGERAYFLAVQLGIELARLVEAA